MHSYSNRAPELWTLMSASKALTIQEHLQQFLRRRWSRQFGLAISGGVDSMALAHLCSASRVKADFIGFIVDHGLRPESGDEAANVAKELRRMNIHPRILKLDWSNHGDPKSITNFETIARKLRYQALGKACFEERIPSMLVGHHADDQAETVLVRILSGYNGPGLRGIKEEVRFPDCEGVYGVDGSGWRGGENAQHLTIEKGDLRILRPLLPFTKHELIDICQANGVKWFEDSTNADQSLTVRNTARHVLASGALPAALQASRLVKISNALRKQESDIELIVQKLFKSTLISLDLSIGQAMFTINPDLINNLRTSCTKKNHGLVKAHYVRRLLQLVSPQTDISLHSLDNAVQLVFGDQNQAADNTTKMKEVQVAFAVIRREGNTRSSRQFSVRRQTPKHSTTNSTVPFSFRTEQSSNNNNPRWSHWLLWDNRYWIRVFSLSRNDLAVTFLTPHRLGLVRKGLDPQERKKLKGLLANANERGASSTIPAILLRHSSGEEQVAALPSLEWQSAESMLDSTHNKGFSYEVSYKEVALEETANHRIVSSANTR